MADKKTLYIIVGVLVLVVVIGLMFMGNKNGKQRIEQGNSQTQASSTAMVDCSNSDNPSCFVERMNQCLPVMAKMEGTDGKTTIEITILGEVDGKCHFQRKLNDVLGLECYFPKGTLDMDTLDQTFGNEKGKQAIVDSACKTVGW